MHNTFYITTSIPYANSSPHLGNTLDSIYADVLARYQRQHGADTRFLTGTDEHGVKIVRSAEAAGLKPQEFVDKNSVKFRELKKVLNLSWDDFIRTSDKERHWPGAVKVWKALEAAGDLYKKTYKGLYCVGHEAFITDKDLSDGICRDHQKKPEVIEEENWFFRLSKYSGEIESRIKSCSGDSPARNSSAYERRIGRYKFFPPEQGFELGSAGAWRLNPNYVCLGRRAH